MTRPVGATQATSEWIIHARKPDYHLTPEAPLWAATHLHPTPTSPIVSIHPGIEVGIVLAGREEVQLEDCVTRGAPGDVWLCAISEPHRCRIVSPNTQNLVLVFLPSFLGEQMLGDLPWLTLFAAPPADRPRVTTSQIRSTVLEIARGLEREIDAKAAGWQCAVRLDLLRLLFYLSRGWDRPALPQAGRRNDAGNLSRIMPALALLNQRIPRSTSRPQAARACGLGRSRFSMIFRETMGVTFRTFSRRARIAYAANMLLTTDLAAADIAEKAGFADASHLHHSFVQEYACTPGQYREQARAATAKRAP